MPLPTLYSKDSVDNLLADKLDLAGGTLTGGLTLSASGIIFSDSTTLTTAPAGGTLAADQLTAGVVATNPAAGPTTAGDVLQYDGTDLIWAAGGGGGGVAWGAITGTLSDQTDLQNALNDKLDLAGGTLTGGLTLSATGIIFSDATTLTTAPTTPDTAADQLTAGTVVTNPAAGPTAADEVLTYDGTDLVWASPVVVWGGITGTLSTQTDLQTELDGKLPVKTVNNQTSSYTLASTDANNIVYFHPSSANLTVPADSTYSFAVGTVIIVVSDNNSQNIVPETIAAFNTPNINNNSASISIGLGLTLVKVAADTWVAY